MRYRWIGGKAGQNGHVKQFSEYSFEFSTKHNSSYIIICICTIYLWIKIAT